MKAYMAKRVKTMVLSTIFCDRCDKRFGEDDWVERQEFLSHEDTAGYGSVFGDGNRVEIDLCQHCVKEVLGPWLRITERNP